MATEILSTNGAYLFKKEEIVNIPVDGQFGTDITPRTTVVPGDVYHIDRTQKFPQTPPEWVMESEFLALLVKDGSVTVK